MAIDYGTSATGKAISQPIAASDGLLSVFSGTAATPPSFTVVHIGRVADVADAFGTSTFAERLSIRDGSANEAYRLRCAPTAGTFGFRIQNTAGTSRAADVTITAAGTNLNGLRNRKYVAALSFDTATRIPTGYVIHDAPGTRTTDSTASTAITAGVGLRLAASCVFGVVANRCFPGVQCLTAVISGALTQAQLEAIWDADDPAWVLHTYRASILWATEYGLLGDVVGTTYPLQGQTVAADSLIVYNSGTQTSWYGVAPSAPTITGTLTYRSPGDYGYTRNLSIVPDGGQDITTEVQNAAANPAAYQLGRAWAGVPPTKCVHAYVTSNSRGIRTNTDPLNRQATNDTYDASQPASVDANWAGGIATELGGYVVGASRVPKVTGSATTGSSASAWSGTLPSTGTVTLKSGTGTNAADVDFSRVAIGSENSTGAGPTQYVAISPSGGIDFLFSNVGSILAAAPKKVAVLVAKYPNSATVTVQAVTHASSSATVPFGSAAANWSSGTLHGSATGPVTLNNSVFNSTVVSYSGSTLTVFADPLLGNGSIIVVDRAGTPCIGWVGDDSSAPSLSMEFPMGAGTGVPTASDACYFADALEWQWLTVDIPASSSPSPWYGIRVTAGASGFPVLAYRVFAVAVNGSGIPIPGVVSHPIGWGGNGYQDQFNAIPSTAGPDGKTVLTRWLEAMRYPLTLGNSIGTAIVVPAQQNSTASSSGTMLQRFADAGWTAQERAFAADFTNANNTSAFATQAFQDFAAYGLTVGPAQGILAVNAFRAGGVPFSQLVRGELADISHKSTEGVRFWADQTLRIFAPVADGGGGAALSGESAGGYRARPSRARLSR